MKNLNFLKNFLTITKFRSLAEYVEATGSAHAYATHTIKEIEKEFGCQIVERFRKRIQLQLTPAGEHIVKKAPSIIAALEDLKKSTQYMTTPQAPLKFDLYVSRAIADYIIAKNIAVIQNNIPEAHLNIYPRELHMSYDEKIGQLTIGAYTPTSSNDVFIQHHLIDYSVNLWAPASYLQKNAPPTSINDLLNHHLLSHRPDSLLIKTLRRYRAYKEENITVINSPAGIMAAANAGAGLVFINSSIRKLLGGDNGQVVLPELNHPTSLYFSHPIAWKDAPFMQKLTETLRSLIQAAFQTC